MQSRSQETLFSFLQETLVAAGKAITACAATDLHIKQKKDRSLVTEADMASERIIIERIKAANADDYIYSEESGCSRAHAVVTFPLTDDIPPVTPDWQFTTRRAGDYVWVIDPLDGTTNFANHYPFYCVSIALGEVQDDGRIVTLAGGVHNPIDGATYLAYHNGGAYCDGQRLSVTAERRLCDSFLGTGIGTPRRHAPDGIISSDLDMGAINNSIRSDGASALDLALVARGIYDGYWEQGLKAWDVAAGWLLVTEAGGVVRNYHTRAAFNMEGGNVIAGNTITVTRLAQFIAQGTFHA